MRALLVVLLVLCGCAKKPPPLGFYDPKVFVDPRGQEVVLGVGDAVAINVWEQKDLTTDATIRADGMITMPLAGDLKAAGVTPSALRAQIKTKLGDFLKFPPGTEPVTVKVTAWRSYRYTIQGEVQRQGTYQPDRFVQVSDAIAQAGGLTRFAKRHDVTIFRDDPRSPGNKMAIPIDYDLLVSGKRHDMNIWILPNDTIYVP